MAGSKKQGQLFAEELDCEDGNVFINEKCHIQTQDGYRVVSVCGLSLAHYTADDRMGEAHAMVSLVEQGWAKQNEVAAAFGRSERTV